VATILTVADAVVAALNAGTFSKPVTAQRHYVPRFSLDEMDNLRVSVVPRGLASRAFDRNHNTFDYQIDVAVQQRTDVSQGSLDALMVLVEEIADFLRKTPLPGIANCKCVEIKNEPIYAPEHLAELRQFTSVLTMTFRIWR